MPTAKQKQKAAEYKEWVQRSHRSLYYLRDTELDPSIAPILAKFVIAHRPHEKPPSRQELLDAGCQPIEKESTMDDLREVYFEAHGFYPEDHPDLNKEEE